MLARWSRGSPGTALLSPCPAVALHGAPIQKGRTLSSASTFHGPRHLHSHALPPWDGKERRVRTFAQSPDDYPSEKGFC